MTEIIKLARATDDLAEIWDYIADDSEAQADLFLDTIDRKLRLLAEQPNLGRSHIGGDNGGITANPLASLQLHTRNHMR